MNRYVSLDEKVTAQFYDDEHEEWTMQTVSIEDVLDSVCDEYTVLPSAEQPSVEPLTDTEQRIFLKAISREEEVCRKVDAKWGEGDEECEINLVHTCHEIVRKVKGALWT